MSFNTSDNFVKSGGDISNRARRIARMIDRLPEGSYNIVLVKDGIRPKWRVRVEKAEAIQEMEVEN